VLSVVALAWSATGPAHGLRHQPGYVATVTSIRPAVPGLTATILGGDELLSIRNWSNRTVVVLDARGRPLVRLAADGVSRHTQRGWQLVKRGTTYTWHDPRIHWGRAQPPAVVAREPLQPHVIASWSIRATVDGRPLRIDGSLGWLPAASAAAREGGNGSTAGWLVALVVLGSLLGAGALAVSLLYRLRGA
jgi:hypothetical protein